MKKPRNERERELARAGDEAAWRAAASGPRHGRAHPRARGPGTRVVLWAHDGHLSVNPDNAPPVMGNHLLARHGADYRSFGFAFDRGAMQAWDAERNGLREYQLAPAAPGSLDDTLAATGLPLLALDLVHLPAAGPWRHL